MAQKDLHNNVKSALALNITAIGSSTTTNGNVIDTKGYEATEFFIFSGAITDGTYTPAIYESDDVGFGTSNVITDPLLIGTTNVVEPLPAYGVATAPITDVTFISTDDAKVARIGVLNKKRYVRLSIVSSGVTTGGMLGALAVLGYPLHAPTPKDK
jgi:hypothetical protein